MIHFPPRRILVGFDRSAESLTAWRHALALAERFGAELEAVYVEPWTTEGPLPGGRLYVPPRLTPDMARTIRAGIRTTLGGGAKVVVTEGDPVARLLRLAHNRRADMIVVGTHGRSGLTRLLLGSTAEAILRSSPVPVYVARGRAAPIRSIVAPVHFTSYSDRGFVFAADVARSLGARLTALHVDVDPIWGGSAAMRLNRLVERVSPRHIRVATRVVPDTDACHGIIAGSAHHDLIVIAEHQQPGLKGVLLSTTAERVLRGTNKSLLVVPAPRPAPVAAR